jgi:MoaA/NifB/PqqE/SkfB family radical SAM enzyme
MNLHYFLIKLNKVVKNNRPKFLYLLISHFLHLRHLYLQFDPIYVCNLACQMCNFSDAEVRKKFTRFAESEIERIGEIFFPYCSNLQIGCDAEPTTYKNYIDLIERAKKHGIPYVSLTTNGQLLKRENLISLNNIGLNELILSAHGLTAEIYEKFMINGSFEKFLSVLENSRTLDRRFKLRLNYTVNGKNFRDLELLPDFIQKYHFDVIQIRQMLDVGQTGFKEFNLEEHSTEYMSIIKKIKTEYANSNVEIFAEQILRRNVEVSKSNVFIPAILRRITPLNVWMKDFDWKNENYWDYCKRTEFTRLLFWGILGNTEKLKKSPFCEKAENAGRYY